MGAPPEPVARARRGRVGRDVVRVDVVEAKAPDELHYLDILGKGYADPSPPGTVRVEYRVSSVLHQEPTNPPRGPSRGQLYDRMVQNAALRGWIEAQPADSWRQVDLRPSYPGLDRVRLHMVTSAYERAAVATARPDGTAVSVDLPTPADGARVYPRRPATLPAGIRVIPEEDGYEPTEDILAGSLDLPSGRIAVTEFLLDEASSASASSRVGIAPTRPWRGTSTNSRASRSPRSCSRPRRRCAGSGSGPSPSTEGRRASSLPSRSSSCRRTRKPSATPTTRRPGSSTR